MERQAAMVESLWPPPARVGPLTSGALADYLAVPDAEDPRFLLPRDRRAAVNVLRHFRSDGTPGARRRIAALGHAIRVTGGWPLARGALSVVTSGTPDTGTIETHLKEILGADFHLGIHLGPPRANRKPILQVLGTNGEPLAFGKLGVDPLTRRLVRAEASALRALAQMDLPGMRVPQLVHEGDWNGAALLVTTPLPLRHADRSVSRDKREAAMVTLATATGSTWSLPGASACLTDQRDRAAALSHDLIRDRLLDSVAVLAEGTEEWEFGCWHGDWMVWNMASLGDELLVWDWERFGTAVPVGWDALHFALRDAFLRSEPMPTVARDLLAQAPELLKPFGVPAALVAPVTHSYLIELALRYTADGQREAGGRTARVEEWLLPVLPRG